MGVTKTCPVDRGKLLPIPVHTIDVDNFSGAAYNPDANAIAILAGGLIVGSIRLQDVEAVTEAERRAADVERALPLCAAVSYGQRTVDGASPCDSCSYSTYGSKCRHILLNDSAWLISRLKGEKTDG